MSFLESTHRKTYAEVHLGNLRENARQLSKMCKTQTFFCPMVKSFAYGHGELEVVSALHAEGVRWFGVALIEEAMRIRELKLPDIRLLNFALFAPESAASVVANKITPVISEWHQVESLEGVLAEGAKYPIHLKFDSGMHRLGFNPDEAGELLKRLEDNSRFDVEGLCTHLASAEDGLIEGATQQQLKVFLQIEEQLRPLKIKHIHVNNSAGVFAHYVSSGPTQVGVRPGISLYGMKPALLGLRGQEQVQRFEGLELKPVMSLKSEIIKLRAVSAGESISYGGRWTAKVDSIIGVVPIGYADGFFRRLSNNAEVLFRGERVSVVGTVCMDYIHLDLTQVLQRNSNESNAAKSGIGDGRLGEEVVIFGSQLGETLSVEEVANRADTISYEVLTAVGPRVPRKYIE